MMTLQKSTTAMLQQATAATTETTAMMRARRRRRPKKAKVVKEKKEKKPRKEKKQKDTGGPKRPMSAYMLWLNNSRERIKSENPGISITGISKKAGEMWRQLGKDEKEEWEGKAGEAKRQYDKAKKEYKESGGGSSSVSKKA